MNYYKERAIQLEEDLRDARETLKTDLDALENAQKWVNEDMKNIEALEKELAEIIDPKV